MILIQRCADCGAWQYPERDACRGCLSDALGPAPHPGDATVLATAIVCVSQDVAWRSRLPVSVATVRLDEGPHLIALSAAAPGARVNVRRAETVFHADAP